MFIKQLTVFLENKDGRLEKVTEILQSKDINILSITLADTKDYGVLRIIVTDPDKGVKSLRDANFSARLVDVIGVKIPHQVGKLHEMLKHLSKENIGISYMYLLGSGKVPSMIIKATDSDKALSVLEDNNYEILKEVDVYWFPYKIKGRIYILISYREFIIE